MHTTADTASPPFDVIVIGGSYAGLSAATLLARARRSVLVIDAGLRRNRFAAASHGFLGHDGRAPEAIAADGKAQLLAYPDARWQDGTAEQVSQDGDAFTVTTTEGRRWQASHLILASGVIDELPTIEGLAERFGRSVFHCPYCHGFELASGRIGVIAVGEVSLHQALLLPDWGTVTLLTDDAWTPDADQLARLQARGVTVEPARIRRVSGTATVELDDGRRLDFAGLFTATRTRLASPLAGQLGCAFDEGLIGDFIRTDPMKATTVPRVFACGDAARGMHSVALAVGDGALAGAGVHRSLVFG